MLPRLFFSTITTLLMLEIIKPLETKSEKTITKNNIINKFCIATLKSKPDIKNKQNFNEISHFTCECFFKRYNSGNSLKSSRIYCRNKASEKYNL